EIQPGKKHSETVSLLRYLRFQNPGTYKIRVSHDLGWTATDERKHPVAEATIKLQRPTPEQARRLVEDLYTQGKDAVDFHMLSDPVYLQILPARANEACEKALAGISGIATPDATRALILLASHDKAEFALRALQALNERLPDPQLDDKLPSRNVFDNDRLEARRWLVKQAWHGELAPFVRQLAQKLLAKKDVTSVQCGAYILQCTGRKEEV